ncbi:hypothetical protein KCU69_g34, partial [Aureobasidium melanogenum]
MVVLKVSLHFNKVGVQLSTVRIGADKAGVDMVGQLGLSGYVDVVFTLPRLDGTTSADGRVVAVDEVLWVVGTNEGLRFVGTGEVLRVVGSDEVLGIGSRLVIRQGRVSSTFGRAPITSVDWLVETHDGIVRGYRQEVSSTFERAFVTCVDWLVKAHVGVIRSDWGTEPGQGFNADVRMDWRGRLLGRRLPA